MRPVSKLTGGMIPTPNDNHFAAAMELQSTAPPTVSPGGIPTPPPPPPPGVAAAAKIKAEKAEADTRREAVAYLAGLDCRYYPEAEAALIASLRADRDECVRWEAARALLHGCCCTSKTTEALLISATGSDRDGNPGERSVRVRQTALAALQKCQRTSPGTGGPSTPPEQPLAQDGSVSQFQLAQFTAASTESHPGSAEPASNADASSQPSPTLWGIWQAAWRKP